MLFNSQCTVFKLQLQSSICLNVKKNATESNCVQALIFQIFNVKRVDIKLEKKAKYASLRRYKHNIERKRTLIILA